MLIQFHEGARFDTGTDAEAVPRCQATNAELQLLGPDACRGSRLGTNEVRIDTGFPDGPRYIDSTVTALNGRLLSETSMELILVAESEVPPEEQQAAPAELRSPIKVRSVIRGTVSDVTGEDSIVPRRCSDSCWEIRIVAGFLPGMPPDGGARVQERLYFPPIERYLTTPPKCTSNGYWSNTITYWYSDGAKETSSSRSPCIHGRGDRARGGHHRPIV